MIKPANKLPHESHVVSGEIQSLLEQLGSSDQEISLAGVLPNAAEIQTPAQLRQFLRWYENDVLVPIELPAIHRAYLHTLNNECRELLELDRSISPGQFREASERVGRIYLKRLRPLRDHRLVQRYLQAIDARKAHGWHTLVYGVTLAVYSFPIRQGLTAYANQTVNGFVQAGTRRLGLPEESEAFSVGQFDLFPQKIEALLGSGGFTPRVL
jgi:hypothetical protein